MEISELLKKCPLFAGLNNEELSRLRKITVLKKYQKTDLLFAEGQPSKGFYLLSKGKIKLYKLSAEGKEQILHIVNPGEPFAEAALFSGATYPAYAEALTKSEVLFFPKTDFMNLLHDDPQLSLNMLATMSKFLRRFNLLVERLSLRDISARLAQYLLQEISHSSHFHPQVELKMTKTQLASQLGTVSETLSRTLKKLKDEKIITVQGKVITVLDQEALKSISGASMPFDQIDFSL